MKTFHTILLIILSQTILLSQEFAPIGAKWYVEIAEPFEPGWAGTLTNESIRDTIMEGMFCKIMYKSEATAFNEIVGEYILCQSGDLVFHYIESLDTMNLVMDFGAEIGDSWESFDRANEFESFGTQRNYKYIVESISFINSNSQVPLKVQHLKVLQKDWSEPDSEYNDEGYTDELIRSLGFKSALLPSNTGDGFTDGQYETDIRCYEDPLIGLVTLSDDGNCTLTSTNETNKMNIEIYPNPSSGIINIDGIENSKDVSISVYDCQANIMFKVKDTNQINMEHLLSGLYYVQIRSNEIIFVDKILLLK